MEQAGDNQTLSNDLETALIGLMKLIKAQKFYPAEHPALATATSDASEAFQPLLKRHDTQAYHVTQEGFSLKLKTLAPQNQSLKELATALVARRVRQLLFLPNLSSQELLTFAEEVSRPVDELLMGGGLPERLAERQVKSIWINETDLEEILRLVREKELEQPQQSDDTIQDTANEQQEQEDSPEPPPVDPQIMNRIRELLKRLKEPQEDHQYEQLIEQLLQLAPPFLQHTGLPGIMVLISLLLNHRQDSNRSRSQRQAAGNCCAKLLTGEVSYQLVEAVADPTLNTSQQHSLQKVLHRLKLEIAPQLIEKLSTEEDSSIRRQYTAILSKMGEALFPLLENMLLDERWYVARNALIILGNMRSHTTIPLLELVNNHQELRVQRALIQALSMTGSGAAVPLLADMFHNQHADLHRPAIMALGALGDPQAIPHLLQILRKSGLFSNQTELKLETIRALAAINSPVVIKPLLKLARSINLLQSNNIEQLRAEAIMALGQLGNHQLLPTLEHLPRVQKDPVKRALKQAMAQLRKTANAT